jgi:pimeloyl-ACP methyl ester carboxylesterase
LDVCLLRSLLLDNKETIKELTTKLPPFTSEEAGKVSKPTLLIKGENCPKALCTIVEPLAKNMHKSQSTTVSKSAHFPHFENPKEFNSKINGFLSKQTA